MTLADLAGSDWAGTAELWLDPLGNDAQTSDCSLHVESTGLRYIWHHDGTLQHGTIVSDERGGRFTDTWHQPTAMVCTASREPQGLLDLRGTYGGGDGPPWGWRIVVALRPPFDETPESLVLQMTNITPWGEEVRAVRMTSRRRQATPRGSSDSA